MTYDSSNNDYSINIVDKADVTETPAVEETVAPAVEETTAQIEETVPSVEETTAQIEETAPAAEEKTEAVTVVEDITVEATEEYIEATFDNNYIEYYFRTENQLEQHFQKHGYEFEGDFDYETAEDYEIGASDVINNPDALYKTEADDGDGVYYLEGTNEFVVLSKDGYIRTYFRPSAGIDYFNRQ
jgi:pyocin large subunit-like protein